MSEKSVDSDGEGGACSLRVRQTWSPDTVEKKKKTCHKIKPNDSIIKSFTQRY